jgi:hypothetical protein
MVESGMPHKWWPFAAEYYSFAKNTMITNGESPYNRRLNRGHCTALRIPFGAKIQFMPNPVKIKDLPTFAGKHIAGVFLGWDADPGGKWSKSYIVISIEDAQGSNTHNSRVHCIQRLREIETPTKITYPLYDIECAKMFIDKKASSWPVESVADVEEPPDMPMHLKKGYMIEAYVVGNIKFDKFDNRITRKYKGSKRPPHTWPEAWSLMTPKDKAKAILEHTRSVEQYESAEAPESTLRSTRQPSSASGSHSPAAAARVASKTSAAQPTLRSSAGTRKDDMCCRHIIEWCCSPDSLIGSEKFNNDKTSCVTTRITEDIDGTSTEGLQYAKNKYNKMKVLPTVIFASLPCTGGTTWNSVNIRNKDGAEKIQQHIDLFDKLWTNFTKLVEHCSSPTTTVVIEWPRNCLY